MGDADEHNILKLQGDLQKLQEAFVGMVEKKNKREIQQTLKELELLQPEVHPPDLPQLPEDLLSAPVSQVDLTELRREIKKRMKLLEILMMKVNCPISKVVDKL